MMTTTKKFTVTIGSITDEISGDLLSSLNYHLEHWIDGRLTAKYMDPGVSMYLASAYDEGLRGDDAALRAIRYRKQAIDAQNLETARQKIAEIQAKAADDHRAAEAMALKRQREAQEHSR